MVLGFNLNLTVNPKQPKNLNPGLGLWFIGVQGLFNDVMIRVRAWGLGFTVFKVYGFSSGFKG